MRLSVLQGMSGPWSGYWYENPLHGIHFVNFMQMTAVLQLNPNAPYLSLRDILASVESQRARPRYPYLMSALDGIMLFLILTTRRYFISIHVLANRECSCGYRRTLYLYLRDALQQFSRSSSCIDFSTRPSQRWKYWDGSLYSSNIHECKLTTFLRLPSYS